MSTSGVHQGNQIIQIIRKQYLVQPLKPLVALQGQLPCGHHHQCQYSITTLYPWHLLDQEQGKKLSEAFIRVMTSIFILVMVALVTLRLAT